MQYVTLDNLDVMQGFAKSRPARGAVTLPSGTHHLCQSSANTDMASKSVDSADLVTGLIQEIKEILTMMYILIGQQTLSLIPEQQDADGSTPADKRGLQRKIVESTARRRTLANLCRAVCGHYEALRSHCGRNRSLCRGQ